MKKKNNNTPPSSYRLPKETLEKIRLIQEKYGCSKTEVIRMAVENYSLICD